MCIAVRPLQVLSQDKSKVKVKPDPTEAAHRKAAPKKAALEVGPKTSATKAVFY